MNAFRHRLASGALVLIALQLAVLFAAPMACCVPFGQKAEVKRVATADAAALAECPLHKSKEPGSTSKAPDSYCRMTCDAPHGSLVLLGAIGVLAAPASAHVEIVSAALPRIAAPIVAARPAVPDAPPPRLL